MDLAASAAAQAEVEEGEVEREVLASPVDFGINTLEGGGQEGLEELRVLVSDGGPVEFGDDVEDVDFELHDRELRALGLDGDGAVDERGDGDELAVELEVSEVFEEGLGAVAEGVEVVEFDSVELQGVEVVELFIDLLAKGSQWDARGVSAEE